MIGGDSHTHAIGVIRAGVVKVWADCCCHERPIANMAIAFPP